MASPGLSLVLDAAGATAPDGRCKSFDASGDGYGRGEGGGIVVLKRLSDARRDGDRILALIRGSAVQQDGKTSGIMAPNGEAQAHLMRRAYESAGLDPATVGYVEAHGTGTRAGDPLEAGAMASVFGAGLAERTALSDRVREAEHRSSGGGRGRRRGDQGRSRAPARGDPAQPQLRRAQPRDPLGDFGSSGGHRADPLARDGRSPAGGGLRVRLRRHDRARRPGAGAGRRAPGPGTGRRVGRGPGHGARGVSLVGRERRGGTGVRGQARPAARRRPRSDRRGRRHPGPAALPSLAPGRRGGRRPDATRPPAPGVRADGQRAGPEHRIGAARPPGAVWSGCSPGTARSGPAWGANSSPTSRCSRRSSTGWSPSSWRRWACPPGRRSSTTPRSPSTWCSR